MCHGVRFADVVHRPRPFQPARGSSMRPSICFTKKPIGYGTRATAQRPFCSTSSASERLPVAMGTFLDRKSTRLNSSHSQISYAVFCLKKKKKKKKHITILKQ